MAGTPSWAQSCHGRLKGSEPGMTLGGWVVCVWGVQNGAHSVLKSLDLDASVCPVHAQSRGPGGDAVRVGVVLGSLCEGEEGGAGP